VNSRAVAMLEDAENRLQAALKVDEAMPYRERNEVIEMISDLQDLTAKYWKDYYASV
jgi:hypothetical protein